MSSAPPAGRRRTSSASGTGNIMSFISTKRRKELAEQHDADIARYHFMEGIPFCKADSPWFLTMMRNIRAGLHTPS